MLMVDSLFDAGGVVQESRSQRTSFDRRMVERETRELAPVAAGSCPILPSAFEVLAKLTAVQQCEIEPTIPEPGFIEADRLPEDTRRTGRQFGTSREDLWVNPNVCLRVERPTEPASIVQPGCFLEVILSACRNLPIQTADKLI